MGFLSKAIADRFEQEKPEALQADIRMISGCEDSQTSADVSNVSSFKLPNPAGRSGGACTSVLLNVLYKDEKTPADALSFVQVLEAMRNDLKSHGYEQIPQLTASQPIDINKDFDISPPGAKGTKRAVMIGINYVGHEQGQLSGCINDCKNMKKYIQAVHGFKPANITVLMDDGAPGRKMPTRDNILAAFKNMVAATKPGDALFVHYSGHGAKIKDDNNDEADGYDESLVPVDYDKGAQFIRDDDLFDTLVKPLPKGAHLFCLFDCCHSGSALDLPYMFKPGGEFGDKMELVEGFNFDKFMTKLSPDGQKVVGFLKNVLSA